MDLRDMRELMIEVHELAKSKGWWDNPDRNFAELIALMHSELSEALEEYRKYDLDQYRFLYFDSTNSKPEGIASELADVVIRICDACQRYKIPLVEAIQAKHEYNSMREHRHGGKVC